MSFHYQLTLPRRKEPPYFSAILISVLLHAALLYFLTLEPSPPQLLKTFEVEFVEPKVLQQAPPIVQTQIVTEPENVPESKVIADNAFLAEKTRTTDTLQIKRGLDPEAGPAPNNQERTKPAQATNSQNQESRTNPQSSQPAQRSTANAKNLSLKLDTKKVLEGLNTSKTQQAGSDQSYSAFSRASGSGARFLGLPGSSDYLPNLPDGDITLLNTKASLHAVFVRRVAVRVFSELRTNGWDTLRAQDIQSVKDFSKVRAILSPSGELLSVEAIGSSGSIRFDQILQEAAQKGARDSNPPKEAAAPDGNIHFLFYARSWVRFGPSARSGFPREQRWLLLSTGLE